MITWSSLGAPILNFSIHVLETVGNADLRSHKDQFKRVRLVLAGVSVAKPLT